jgi:methylated-DNA-[protein]-cysteine S-methyltransferase
LVEIASVRKDGAWFSVALNEDGKLMASSFSDRSRREAERSVRNALPSTTLITKNIHRANSWSLRELSAFYKGNGKRVDSSTFDLSFVSDFRRKVYEVLLRIPRGRVTTYGAIANRLGGKRYARAVGTAVATNPLSLIVPCHRVVPVSFRVGNYGMGGREPSTGGYMKRRLLELEGVKFQGGKVSKASNWNPNRKGKKVG